MNLTMQRMSCLLFAVVAANCLHAQGQESVDRPHVNVGDSWTYKSTSFNVRDPHDDPKVDKTDQYTFEVTATSQSELKGSWGTYDTDWNLKKRGVSSYDPAEVIFRFPLKAGERFKNSYKRTHGPSNSTRTEVVDIKAMGWEEVDVPAGKFRALRISVFGTSFETKENGRPTITDRFRKQIWYVPSVKRWVKRSYEGRGTDGRLSYITDEVLVEVKLK